MTTVQNSHDQFNGWRTQPMYTFSETSRLAHVSATTVRNWLFGYTADGRVVPPLFKTQNGQGPMVSFLQLVEIVVAGQFRKAEHVSYRTVHQAYENARKDFNLEYPFAHLRLEAIGGHIVRRLREELPGASLQAIDQPQQWTLPGLVLDVIRQLKYEKDLAARWFPLGDTVPIVIDPQYGAGMPTIPGRGLRIEVIYKRWKAGNQKIELIADDYGLERDTVEEVVRYAEKLAA